MTISFVVAAARNNAIGKEGKMPWHLPADLKHFKNITWGFPVVMGRKTFESLGKPLMGRTNIVLTRDESLKLEGAIIAHEFEAAEQIAKEAGVKEMMVIGGGEIYKMLFPKAGRIYITRIDATPEADTFFPEINPGEWQLISSRKAEADAQNSYNYSFEVWERKIKQ